MEQKSFTVTPELKQLDDDGQPGVLVARFATLNVIDADQDVTLPGAFGEQEVRIQPAGHKTRDFMIGKGRIFEQNGEAIVEARLNLGTTAGKDAYEALKFDLEHGRPLQEWSYIFDIEDSELGQHEGEDVRFLKRLRVYSVDPVFLGAGVRTQTMSVKETKRAIPPHGTATAAGPWDGPANESRIPNDAGRATLRRAYAWADPERDPETKTAYRFIHHDISSDGAVGAASLTASSAGIAVLNGGRGGTTIPEADRQGVWNHLARHLRDGDRESPELREADPPDAKSHDPMKGEHAHYHSAYGSQGGDHMHFHIHTHDGDASHNHTHEPKAQSQSFEEAAAAAIGGVAAFVAQTQELVAAVQEKGEALSERKRESITALLAEVDGARAGLDALLKEPEPAAPSRALASELRMAEARYAVRELESVSI